MAKYSNGAKKEPPKKTLLWEIEQGLKEVKKIKEGKIKGKSLAQLLDEI